MNIKINRREESSWKSEGNTGSVEEITGRLNTRWERVYDQAWDSWPVLPHIENRDVKWEEEERETAWQKWLTLFCRHPPLLMMVFRCSSRVCREPSFTMPGWAVGGGTAGRGGRHWAQQEPGTCSISSGPQGRSGHGALEQSTCAWPLEESCWYKDRIRGLGLWISSLCLIANL